MTDFKKAIKQVNEKFAGKNEDNAVFLLSDNAIADVEAISTGSIGLDDALGVGGIPRGRIVETYGDQGSGKTTLALHLIHECQKDGGNVAFIDAEHALDRKYAQDIGVDLDRIALSQPNSGERGLAIMEEFIRTGTTDLIVIDSVAALTPEAEADAEIGDAHIGLQARMMAQSMRRLPGIIGNSKTTVLFINQIRSNINASGPWGPQTTTTGGRALKFAASVRLEIRRIGSVKDSDDNVIGNETKVKVVKNKVAPPMREVTFDIVYGVGISKPREVIQLGKELGIIDQKGAYVKYNDQSIGQGIAKAVERLESDNELFAELESQIRERLRGGK